jgi:hypothetical protein
MRKSKFTESQIVGILAEGESGLAVGDVCRKHGISMQPITSGRASTRESLPMSSNGLRILRPRTASSSTCMPSLLWRIRRSRMFYRESCSAGSKESCGHGDGPRPSNLQGQSLQDRGFLAVGVLQIHSGLWRPRTRQ